MEPQRILTGCLPATRNTEEYQRKASKGILGINVTFRVLSFDVSSSWTTDFR